MKRRILLAAFACMLAGAAAYSVRHTKHVSFVDLWLTPDQQGRCYVRKGDYRRAAERFRDPSWKGIAYYKSGNFEAAASEFVLVQTAEGYFDLGDACAHLGELEKAQASFEEALRRRPNDKDIQENLELVKSLILEKAKKKEEEEPPQGEEPTYKPDEIKIDEKGKKGKEGEVDQAPLSDEQVQELWMRRLQTTPSEFLRQKFAIQARSPEATERRSAPEGHRG